MKSMKDSLDEVNRLRQRARRLAALDRIAEEDCHYIINRLREIEERILTMPEHNTREEGPF